MFLIIPLVEFLHVLGVDINVHHENPATFLCHMFVSSVERNRHPFASSCWHPVLTPGAQERPRDTNWGAHLSGHSPDSGVVSAMFRLIEAHRNETRAQPASFAANRSGCSPRSHSPCVYRATRPLQGPLSPSLTVPPSIKSSGGRRH